MATAAMAITYNLNTQAARSEKPSRHDVPQRDTSNILMKEQRENRQLDAVHQHPGRYGCIELRKEAPEPYKGQSDEGRAFIDIGTPSEEIVLMLQGITSRSLRELEKETLTIQAPKSQAVTHKLLDETTNMYRVFWSSDLGLDSPIVHFEIG
ncbi:hypothetical protein BJV78DRAFT_1157738 [Lactifluus subvellereus]|nr:hypothetical protein BJV78DRAFT_1157738 [Lactifluus subvellereus]